MKENKFGYHVGLSMLPFIPIHDEQNVSLNTEEYSKNNAEEHRPIKTLNYLYHSVNHVQ